MNEKLKLDKVPTLLCSTTREIMIFISHLVFDEEAKWGPFLLTLQRLIKKKIITNMVSTTGNICICLPFEGYKMKLFSWFSVIYLATDYLKTDPKRAEHTRWWKILREREAISRKNVWKDPKEELKKF